MKEEKQSPDATVVGEKKNEDIITEIERLEYERLSRNQRRRYDFLIDSFKENTMRMVKTIGTYGKHAWTYNKAKIKKLQQATDEENAYYVALIQQVDFGHAYKRSEIEAIVQCVRLNLKLDDYGSKLWYNAKNDFMRLFYVEECKVGFPDRTTTAYRIHFALKPISFSTVQL